MRFVQDNKQYTIVYNTIPGQSGQDQHANKLKRNLIIFLNFKLSSILTITNIRLSSEWMPSMKSKII